MASTTYPSLRDKIVYITGGAGGIGEALCESFVAQGAKVGIIDIYGQAASTLAEKLGAGSFAVQCDLRDIDQLKSAFATLKQEIGAADMLINNAAHDQRHAWADITPAYWDDRMAVNLRHMFFAIQAVLPDMIAKNAGSIVNFSSTSWKLKMGNMLGYTTAKAAVHGLTRSFMMELGRSNIRINTVFPGWTMTKRQKELWFDDAGQKVLDEHQAMRGLIQPGDIANMVLFLCSDDARFCTGQEFIVDGGWI